MSSRVPILVDLFVDRVSLGWQRHLVLVLDVDQNQNRVLAVVAEHLANLDVVWLVVDASSIPAEDGFLRVDLESALLTFLCILNMVSWYI